MPCAAAGMIFKYDEVLSNNTGTLVIRSVSRSTRDFGPTQCSSVEEEGGGVGTYVQGVVTLLVSI